MVIHDAVVVGGGPAGSTCARFLRRGGARVAVVDRAEFPRVKLCAGWLSAPIWDALELSPREYTGGLWEWRTCHVRFRGEDRAIACRGWFIRRYELDDFLLRASGAELHLGKAWLRTTIERDADGLWRVGDLRARHLVGAGGTHCPVARLLQPARPRGPVGVQEHEFQADPQAVARTRKGGDGEPELLLHDDLRGYSWNVPKTDWLNVGSGTVDPTEVRAAWRAARAHFSGSGHLPDDVEPALDAVKGHSYYLFDPAHLEGAARVDGPGGAYLVGDSLGLAQPLTAEGILPAVVSGRLCAEAILAGQPASYPARLRDHPVGVEYRRIHRLREAGSALGRRGRPRAGANGSGGSRLGRRAVATGFAWMFSGARLPAPRLIDLALAGAERWLNPGAGAATTANRTDPTEGDEAMVTTTVAATAQKLLSSLDDRRAAQLVRDLLAGAGIEVGGDAPWDIQVRDERLYTRVLRDGTLAVGEAYVEGWWDAPALDQMMDKILRAHIDDAVRDSWVLLAHAVKARLFNLQLARAFEVGERHYDIGNDLYRPMLGERMMYTCAYWNGADDLDAAQEAKLDLVCRKIGLRPGMRVLDLGCGWGGFAAFAAERYGAQVVGMTVSREQVAWAREHYAHLPAGQIDIRLEDYRNATGTYDAVVSIGLMEHVGPKNYRGYMELAARCLAPGGVAFMHTIAGNRARTQLDPWFQKNIFPNAVLPTLGQLGAAMDEILVPEDMHNIGEHYDRTLMAWWDNFEAAWPDLRQRYGDAFYRMWKYYILTSAAGFRARQFQLYQIVATPVGTPQPPACRQI